jgi:hypothetical protein
MKEEMVEIVARDGATFTKNPDVHGMFTNRDDIIMPNRIVDDSVGQEYLNPYTEITAQSSRERAAYFQYGWIAGPIPVPFGKRELIWIEQMKRTDDHYGFSPVQFLAKSLQMLLYMIESDLEYYNDNNVPKGIIGLDESDADEIKAFKEQWFETQRTKDEVGSWKKIMNKVPIVNKTPTFQRIEFSASEMQVIEKQKWYTKMVWASFGVTAVELGYTEDAKGSANQIVQSKVFRKKAINPMLRNLESNYNMSIVSEFGYFGEIKTPAGKVIKKPKYQFKFKKFDVDEESTKYELYKLQTSSGLKTINEIRKSEGLDDLEWGDDAPKDWMQSDGNNFTFGDQYSGEQFDPNLPTGETWAYDRINYFDFGLGTNIYYQKDTLFNAFIGLSVAHINTPLKSFAENSDAYLPAKWSVSAGGEYNVKDDFYIEPVFLAMFQQKYTEYNLGLISRFDYNPANLQSIYFGGIVRTSDAGIICFGMKYHDVKLMINYDINMSNLSSISKGKGGVEFSLIYIFLKPRPFETPHYRKCPDFI